MARQTNVEDLYRFLYHATSEWVHFSPRLLMRMGWGEDREVGATFRFSTTHFDDYYRQFNQTYSAYLLVRLVESFSAELEITEVDDIISRLKAALEDELRWPELVTYEEMNVDPPDLVKRSFMRTACRLNREQHENS